MSRDADANWMDRLAHDLRGPLAPLQTASYLLRRDDLDPARRDELLSMLERQTRRLARMLDELDDWTRAGRQRLLGQHERCELALLLDYALVGSGLVGSGLGGTPVDDDGAIIEVDGDQQRLTQLLRTLVDLAVSRGGVPQFSLRSSDDHGRVQARMPGPAPDAATLATLFDTPQPEPYDEGLGLRLMLARAIARAHGGELTADIDDGTLVLRIDLPLAPPP